VIHLPKGGDIRVTARDEKELTVKVREMRKRIAAGMRARESTALAGPFLDTWLRDTIKGSVSPVSYYTYEGHILALRPLLGKWRICDITPQDVQRWVSLLSHDPETGKRLSPSYVRSCYNRLASAMRTAVEWDMIERTPCRGIRLPELPDQTGVALSVAQVKALLAAASGHQHEPLIRLLLISALRIGEALALEWGDLDADRRTLRIRRTVHWQPGGQVAGPPKTKRSVRTIALDSTTMTALATHRAEQRLARVAARVWVERDLMFPNTQGNYWASRQVRQEFHDMCDEAGIPRVRLHDLRHTSGTLRAHLGVTLRELQETMGHASGKTTNDIYGHVLDGCHEETARRLERLLGAGDEDGKEDAS
jgi:integrase